MHLGFKESRLENPRPVLLFGANGSLGRSLRQVLNAGGHQVRSISWNDAANWLDGSDQIVRERRIRADIMRYLADGNVDVLFASGLTDPRQPAERLFLSNTHFPRSVIAATLEMFGCRYITFGTILERFGGNVADNPYAASKIELGRWLVEQAGGGEGSLLRGRIIHLQPHTLYGGPVPAGHMFLGQMIDALRSRRPFAMSAGRQLREYHHVEDVAGSVARLLSVSDWPSDPILPLSSGRPVRLADLARTIFEDCGRISDLRIGALATGEAENFERTFPATSAWLLEPSREPLSGVSAWVSGLSGCREFREEPGS
jgi:nucleoside-diphosphate-sugar epimerase